MDLCQVLEDAIKNGDGASARAAIDYGAKARYTTHGGTGDFGHEFGFTLLMDAASRGGGVGGSVEVIEALLEAPVPAQLEARHKDVDGHQNSGCVAIHFAAQGGHPDAVDVLLDYGAEVNALDAGGRTPLMRAAYRGSPSSYFDVEAESDEGSFGFGFGAPPKLVPNTTGDRPSDHSNGAGAADAVRRLLRAGASINACDTCDRTAVMYAAAKGDVDVVDLLLAQRGVNVGMVDEFGHGALRHAVGRGSAMIANSSPYDSFGDNDREDREARWRRNARQQMRRDQKPDYGGVVEKLLRAGAEVDIDDSCGTMVCYTKLFDIALRQPIRDDDAVLRSLLVASAAARKWVNNYLEAWFGSKEAWYGTKEQWTPLMHVVTRTESAAFRWRGTKSVWENAVRMLRAGADMTPTNRGKTALHYSLRQGNIRQDPKCLKVSVLLVRCGMVQEKF